jgi:hypothetical protein
MAPTPAEVHQPEAQGPGLISLANQPIPHRVLCKRADQDLRVGPALSLLHSLFVGYNGSAPGTETRQFARESLVLGDPLLDRFGALFAILWSRIIDARREFL